MKTRTLWAIAITLLMALGACSHDSDNVLRTIPADSEMVAKINLNAILSSAGCKEDGGKWQLGSELEALTKEMNDGERMKLLGAIDAIPAVDADNIYIFRYRTNTVLTCGLKHSDALAAELEKEYGEPVSFDGLKVYDSMFAIRGNQMWITDRTDLIADMLKAAQKTSAADCAPMEDCFSAGESDIAVCTNYAASLRNVAMIMPGFSMPEEFTNSYAIYKIHFDGNSARMEGSVVNDKMKTISAHEYMKPIGSDVCAFMPARPAAAFAMGKFDEKIIDVLKSSVPGYARSQVSEVLDALDGSICMGIAPPASFENLLQPELWTLTIAVQCKKDKAEELLGLLPMLAQNDNAELTQMDDQTRLCFKGGLRKRHDLNVYIGYFGGTLVASTQPVAADSNKDLGRKIGNSYFAGIADMPASGETIKGLGLPFGLTGEMHTGKDDFSGHATLDGSDRPFLAAIIGAFTDDAMHRRVGETIGRLAE